MTLIYQENNLLRKKIKLLFICNLKCIYIHKNIDEYMIKMV